MSEDRGANSLVLLNRASEIVQDRDEDAFSRLKRIVDLFPAMGLEGRSVGCRISLDGCDIETPHLDDYEQIIGREIGRLVSMTGTIEFFHQNPSSDAPLAAFEHTALETLANLIEQTVVHEQHLGLFRRTFEAIGQPVLIIDTSEDGRKIIDANPAALAVFGYERDELVGSTTEMLHVDRGSFEEFGDLDQQLNEADVIRTSFAMKRRDGEVFAAEQIVSVVEPWIGLDSGAVSIIRDLSKEKEAEERVRRSERRLTEIAEAIDDVFWVMSSDGSEIEYMSPAFDDIWGGDRGEVLEDIETWHRSIVDRDRERVLEKRLEGPAEFEYEIELLDGETRWIEERVYPVQSSEDGVHRIVGVSKDVSRRMNLESMLRRSQKMQAVGRLASGIAHDFNNLLAVILGGAELIRSELSDVDPLVEDIEFIKDAATKGAELTRQLMTFSASRVPDSVVLDMGEVIHKMSALLERSIPENIHIDFEVSAETLPVRMDSTLLEQALLNLVLNARDAMPDGGTLRIVTGLEQISPDDAAVKDVEPGAYAVLSVEDDGIGMNQDVQSKIFEPFFTTKSEGEGTGLGLPMVYGTVRKHNGSIDVTSHEGVGTKFIIRLPVTDEKPASDESNSEQAAPRSRSEDSLRILVVEDEAAVRRVIVRILEHEGHCIDAFEGVDEATKLLSDPEEKFDLLLCDMVLKTSSGRELLSWTSEIRPELPCVLMSGYTEGRKDGESEIPSQVKFLSKPFTRDELLGVLAVAINEHERTRQIPNAAIV